MRLLRKSYQTPKGMKLVRFMTRTRTSESRMAMTDIQRFQYVCEHCWTSESPQPQNRVRMRLSMQRLADQQEQPRCNLTACWLIHLLKVDDHRNALALPRALGRWALGRNALSVEFSSFLSAVLPGMCAHTNLALTQPLMTLLSIHWDSFVVH